MPLIIKNLHASAEKKEILKGVNLTIKSGEIHAVMGPNGAGKSSLARVLVGDEKYEIVQQKKSSTKVVLDSDDLLSLPIHKRAHKGLFLAFQHPVEIPGLKVQNFLWRVYKTAEHTTKSTKLESVLEFRKYVQSLVDEFGIDQRFLTRGLNEDFSGGEKKQLEVLQLMVLQPKYAILDEIDSGLDIDALKTVAKGVQYVVEKYNTGILLITHYQRILQHLIPNKIHIMIDGKIVKSGGKEVMRQVEEKGYKEFRG